MSSESAVFDSSRVGLEHAQRQQLPATSSRNGFVWLNVGILATVSVAAAVTVAASVALTILFPPFIVLTASVGASLLAAELVVAGTSAYALVKTLNLFAKKVAPLVIPEDAEPTIVSTVPVKKGQRYLLPIQASGQAPLLNSSDTENNCKNSIFLREFTRGSKEEEPVKEIISAFAKDSLTRQGFIFSYKAGAVDPATNPEYKFEDFIDAYVAKLRLSTEYQNEEMEIGENHPFFKAHGNEEMFSFKLETLKSLDKNERVNQLFEHYFKTIKEPHIRTLAILKLFDVMTVFNQRFFGTFYYYIAKEIEDSGKMHCAGLDQMHFTMKDSFDSLTITCKLELKSNGTLVGHVEAEIDINSIHKNTRIYITPRVNITHTDEASEEERQLIARLGEV